MIDPDKTAQLIGVGDPFTEAEWNKVKQDVLRKVRYRKIQRRSLKVLTSGVVIGAALLGWKTYSGAQRASDGNAIPKAVAGVPVPSVQAASAPIAPNVGPCTVRFPDGSAVNLADNWSTLTSHGATSDHVDVELVSGTGRFDIVPDSTRHFRVRAGSVLLDVIGTVFTLVKLGEQVSVTVERGSVHLLSPGSNTFVTEGQVGIYPSAMNGAASGGEEARATVFATPIAETRWW